MTKLLDGDELIVHRAEVAKTDPSLPQRAGRALAAFEPPFEFQPPQKRAPIPRAIRTVVLRAVVRPEPDVNKLARALLTLARAEAKKQRKD